jgi:Zn-dependent peptidase ImmA (M78 family)
VIRPPIPVERIAHLCGGQVRYEPFEGQISGILYNENGRIIIGVNSLHPKTRQRFTIAHEIGHIKLHQGEQFYIDRDFRIYLRDEKSSQATDKKEIQANSFAAELLMPEKMLMADWQERDTGYTYDIENDEFIQSLAKRYKVSLQAMIFRLINLRLIQQP